jgi:hypothetical protein
MPGYVPPHSWSRPVWPGANPISKGPALSLIESFMNDGPASRLADALDQLRATGPDGRWSHRVTDCMDLAGDNFALAAANPRWERSYWRPHIDRDWFGIIDRETGAVDPAAAWWRGFRGEDLEGIVRETFVRAIEIAFGIPHGGSPAPGTPRWPIELFWITSQASFEGWVSWRRLPGDSVGGVVSVFLSTPAIRPDALEQPLRSEAATGPAADASDDGETAHLGLERQGMVMIAHRSLGPLEGSESEAGPRIDEGPLRGHGPVVVVRPSEAEGGIARVPRTWLDPSPGRSVEP